MLRPHLIGNLDTLRQQAKWLNDPDITRYSEQRHALHSVTTQSKYIGSFREPDEFLEIYLGEKMIGTMTSYVDQANSIADIGIMIGDKTMWKQGFGCEAWKALSDHLLNNGIRKIEAGCMSANRAMVHIFRSTAMHYEGRRTEHFLLGSELTDLVQYGRFI